MAKPIPEGFTAVTPYLTVSDAPRAIEFYKRAFGAKEVSRLECEESKKVMHAELELFGSRLMLADEFPEQDCMSPEHYKGTTVCLHLYVKDCDAVFEKARRAGARPLVPLADTFWGDRFGRLQDPFGHEWSVATRKRELTPEQVSDAARKWKEGLKKERRVPAGV